MPTAHRTERIQILKPREKRRFQRVNVSLLGRYMLANHKEYPCQVVNMSPGGVALIAPVAGEIGEAVVAYIDHIGRVEGTIARTIEGGFAISLKATTRKRDKLASQLTWLANRHSLNLPEDRRHERITPHNPNSKLILPDGRVYRAKIIDISLSGASLQMEVRPAIGTPVVLGRIRGQVVRHIDGGVAIEFAAVQDADRLETYLS